MAIKFPLVSFLSTYGTMLHWLCLSPSGSIYIVKVDNIYYKSVRVTREEARCRSINTAHQHPKEAYSVYSIFSMWVTSFLSTRQALIPQFAFLVTISLEKLHVLGRSGGYRDWLFLIVCQGFKNQYRCWGVVWYGFSIILKGIPLTIMDNPYLKEV